MPRSAVGVVGAWVSPGLVLLLSLLSLASCRSRFREAPGAEGGCDLPLRMCEDRCVDLRTDPANCGGCGAACPADATCLEGRCVSGCPEGATRCDDRCVDLASDP